MAYKTIIINIAEKYGKALMIALNNNPKTKHVIVYLSCLNKDKYTSFYKEKDFISVRNSLVNAIQKQIYTPYKSIIKELKIDMVDGINGWRFEIELN